MVTNSYTNIQRNMKPTIEDKITFTHTHTHIPILRPAPQNTHPSLEHTNDTLALSFLTNDKFLVSNTQLDIH